MALAVRRNRVFSVPSGFKISAWRTVTTWPRFPFSFSSTTPAKFWPKSYTSAPSGCLLRPTGANRSRAFTGAP